MEEPVPINQLIATAQSDNIPIYDTRINKIRKGDGYEMFSVASSYNVYDHIKHWKESRKAWLLHAALCNYRDAQYELGKTYYTETPANDQLAMKWMLKAAEQGDPAAMTFIGYMYMKGRGVAVDYKLAMEWYVKALPLDPNSANACIGELHERGLGVPADRLKALEYYFKANNDISSSIARIRKINTEAILNVEKNVEHLVKKNEKTKDEKKVLKRQAKHVKRKLKSSDRKRKELEKKVALLEGKVSAAFTLINDLVSKQQQNETRASSQETTETSTVN